MKTESLGKWYKEICNGTTLIWSEKWKENLKNQIMAREDFGEKMIQCEKTSEN